MAINPKVVKDLVPIWRISQPPQHEGQNDAYLRLSIPCSINPRMAVEINAHVTYDFVRRKYSLHFLSHFGPSAEIIEVCSDRNACRLMRICLRRMLGIKLVPGLINMDKPAMALPPGLAPIPIKLSSG